MVRRPGCFARNAAPRPLNAGQRQTVHHRQPETLRSLPAVRGGTTAALLGLGLHLLISLGWTLVFLVLLQCWPALRTWTRTVGGTVVAGLVYGAVVWLLMDGVVLPLSRARAVSPTVPRFWIQLATHPVVVGLPIALILRGVEPSARSLAPVPVGQPANENR
ncbi:MAG TPA: hypothetical protein VLT82_22915 [Myxococcaceae bacterium]|nr:hypothetical protein [Myxococcaceae bacterium]